MVLLFTTAVCMTLFGILYGFLRTKWGSRSLIWKALATGMAAILACSGAAKGGGLYSWLIFAGIIFCMAADVVLEIKFIRGMLLFGCAHICFIAAYMQQTQVRLCTVCYFAVIYGIVACLFRKAIKELKELKIPAFLYMAVLVFMVSMAGTIFTSSGSRPAAVVCFGAVCFLVSDCIIGFRTVYHRQSIIYGAAILILYYSAVYLLGISALLF